MIFASLFGLYILNNAEIKIDGNLIGLSVYGANLGTSEFLVSINYKIFFKIKISYEKLNTSKQGVKNK